MDNNEADSFPLVTTKDMLQANIDLTKNLLEDTPPGSSYETLIKNQVFMYERMLTSMERSHQFSDLVIALELMRGDVHVEMTQKAEKYQILFPMEPVNPAERILMSHQVALWEMKKELEDPLMMMGGVHIFTLQRLKLKVIKENEEKIKNDLDKLRAVQQKIKPPPVKKRGIFFRMFGFK